MKKHMIVLSALALLLLSACSTIDSSGFTAATSIASSEERSLPIIHETQITGSENSLISSQLTSDRYEVTVKTDGPVRTTVFVQIEGPESTVVPQTTKVPEQTTTVATTTSKVSDTSQAPVITQVPITTQTTVITTSMVTSVPILTTAPTVTTALVMTTLPMVTEPPTVTTIPAVTSKTPVQTTQSPVTTPAEPEIIEPPIEPNAGEADEQAVAERVLEYVNQYRESSAVRLMGLMEYAQFRSNQLVSNFAHDIADQRAAATALQYGQYIDPSLFGASGEPYYRANAREAIAMAGYVGTIEEVAEKLATLVYNSPSHWAYIGSSEYGYIAVGVTYESGMWYCAIEVAQTNTDEY